MSNKRKRRNECAWCRSRFDLTFHHLHGKKYGNENKGLTLCRTCHDKIDFKKTMACYYKSSLKKYIIANKKLY